MLNVNRKGVAVALALFAVLALTLAPVAAQDEEISEFVFAHIGPIRTMDAPVTWYGSTHWLTNLLYECLIWRSIDGSGYVGQAAATWGTIDDTTWRFNLRPGSTFHNGEPLDAEAVKWNIDRVRSREDFMVHPQWQFVKDVIVIDEVTVDVLTHEPFPYFEYSVSFNGCELLPPDYMAEVGEEEFSRSPVGSGPYVLSEFSASDRYVFDAWDDYWGGRPEIDRIIYQVIPEQSAQVAALLAGQVDLISGVPAPDREQLEAAEGISVVSESSGRMQHIYARVDLEAGNMDELYPDYQPATLDPRVRHAISHALDRALLSEVHGASSPRLARVCAHFPEGFADKYATSEAVAAYYDPDLSRQLLAEAGYADGGPTIYLDSPTATARGGSEKEVAEVVKVMLEEVGFNVELNILDPSAYGEQILSPGGYRDTMLVNLGCSAPLVPLFYQCNWPSNIALICNEAWDEVSNEILRTVDFDARMALWERWWEFMFETDQTITLYEIEAVLAYNSADFTFTPRKDGWMTFRGNIGLADG